MTNGKWFGKGVTAGVPICLGYFAVSFALGIAARNIGLDAPQAFFMSLGMVASAGEFAALGLISAGAGILETVMTCIVVNLRYFLMSCAVTQKLAPKMKGIHRLGLAYCMTDEIFALSVAVPESLNPFYTYGITVISVAGWCTGTVLGVVAGNILPAWAVNALSVSLYGMFLAIIIPPARKERVIAVLVCISMTASFIFTKAPGLKEISSGFRIIILTVAIAGLAALLHPIEESSRKDGADQSLPEKKPEGGTAAGDEAVVPEKTKRKEAGGR